MTNTDRILQTLKAASGVLCDDCISRIANVLPRQQVNAITSSLFIAGRIFRQDRLLCNGCRHIKKGSAILEDALRTCSPGVCLIPATQSVLQRQTAQSPVQLNAVRPGSEINLERPWHWEGNVQVMLLRALTSDGWTITHFADTESKETGIDLGVAKGSREILFEVKGYPTTVYDHGPNRGQPKPTPQNSQARQWYSHALLSMMRLREKFPGKEIALCFPDFFTYRRLVESTRSSLQILTIAVYLVSENAEVSVLMEPSLCEATMTA